MLQHKKLAFNRDIPEKPLMRKYLFFPLACMTMACAPAQAVPPKAPVRPVQAPKVEPRVEPAKQKCAHDFRVRKDEAILGRACKGDKEFLLTDRYLRIYFDEDRPPLFWTPEVRVAGDYTTQMVMSETLAPGLATWEATEKNCYLLTKDGTLHMLPNKTDGTTYFTFQMPFPAADITKGKMIFHSGFLFVAGPYGDTTVLQESISEITVVGLPPTPDAAFFTKDNRLFYGVNGVPDAEIKIGGPSLRDVRVINVKK